MRLVLVLSIAWGATSTTTVPPARATETEAPVPRVVFTTRASDDTYNGLAVVDLDGSAPRVVTDPDAAGSDEAHFEPTLHPDGSRLAYVATSAGAPAVHLRDLQTDQDVAIDEGTDPAWSPDGRQLAYTRRTGDRAELVVRDVIGLAAGPARVVHTHPSWLREPAWSPLGDRIAVNARQDDAFTAGVDHTSVVVVDLADRTSTVVSGDLSIEQTPLSWAPDGQALTAVGRLDRHTNEWSALLLPVDGSGPKVLLHADVETIFGTRYAPDGTVVWAMGQQAGELLALSPRGGVVRRLALPGSRDDDQLVIAPDGRTAVLGMSRQDGDRIVGDLFEVDLTTGQGRRLTFDGQYATHTAAGVWPGLTHRVGGQDRIETALELVRRIFDLADCVVLARADHFADALAAGPLAAAMDAPLLLTPPDLLDPRVAREIERLEATCAVLVGGVQALSDDVAAALEDLGLEVERIAGSDRFAVAAAVADRVGTDAGAYLVEGANADPNRGWPDAVAIGALAAWEQRPILLTRHDALPAATARALDHLAAPRVEVIGGEAAISQGVVEQLQHRGITVDRIAGADRYDTSRRIAERAVRAGLDRRSPVVVTGRAWPDALTAGVAAAATGRPVVLVDGADGTGGRHTREWIGDQAGELQSIGVVGGAVAIAPQVVTTIEEVAAPF